LISLKPGRIARNIVAPVLVMAVIIAVFFRDLTPADILASFLRIPPAFLAAFALLSLLGTLFRTWQYSVLLSGELRFGSLFLITLVRNFSVDLLPGRSASLVLYSWLTRKKGIALEKGASSFVMSVFYDSLALTLMLGILLVSFSTGMNRWPIFAAMAILFAFSALVLFFSRPLLQFLLGNGRLRRLRLSRIEETVRLVCEYLAAHEGMRERLKLLGISFASRLCKYVYNYILFEGVLHLGVSLKHFSLFCFGLAATEASALIPVHGPAGFGTWELAFAFVFSALRVPAANIREAGFVIHITSQVWEYAIGLLALAYLAFATWGKTPPLKGKAAAPPTGPGPSRSR
jgi:uncharacterized membrane protein YbhN (UPF0104 family)